MQEVNQVSRSKGSGATRHPVREIIEGRLYSIVTESFTVDNLAGVSVMVNMSGDRELHELTVPLEVFWSADSDVDERVLEGIVRMCASSMRGIAQKVLLVGEQDAIDTIAACVLREYLGCPASAAMDIMRYEHPGCLQKHALIETVLKFRPS